MTFQNGLKCNVIVTLLVAKYFAVCVFFFHFFKLCCVFLLGRAVTIIIIHAFVVRLLHAERRCIPRVAYYKNQNVSVC